MPKRAVPPVLQAPIPALRPPPPISPLVQALRKDWRWAGISQFLWTFSDAFGLVDWDIEALENDLDGDETQLLPVILAKLLFALTYSRQITPENAFENLQKQYIKRASDQNPFGTIEEPIEWATFGLSTKVIWQLCEWQMDDPARFRALLPSDEDSVAWRIDPIGWDKEGNTYYLFDDNRLWRQIKLPALPPRRPKQKQATNKASGPSNTSRQKASKGKKKAMSKSSPPPTLSTPVKHELSEPASGSRRRTQVAFYGNPTSTVDALRRGATRTVDTPTSSRGTRSSHRLTGEPGPSKTTSKLPDPASTPSKASKVTPAPRGTRVSRRLRDVEDEWQQVPEEWLKSEPSNSKASSRANGTGGKGKQKMVVEDDEESVLTELSDSSALSDVPKEEEIAVPSSPVHDQNQDVEDDLTPISAEANLESAGASSSLTRKHGSGTDDQAEREDDKKEMSAAFENIEVDVDYQPSKRGVKTAAGEDEYDDLKIAIKQMSDLPADFVEFEAVCVSLYDWRTWPEQFAKSRDPDEKALYTFLTVHAGPQVIATLTAKEQERLREEAIINRKRSSRIATKELEREEILRREKAQRDMESRMDRSLAEEKRKAREEAEASARETAREDRLKEREERAAARVQAALAKAMADTEAEEQEASIRESRKRRREAMGIDGDAESEDEKGAINGIRPGQPSRAGPRDWELDCEVCKKHGWNIDENEDLVSCDDCGKWQHVDCHNRLDRQEGRVKRNWNRVDFKCQECCRKAARKLQRLEPPPTQHFPQPVYPPMASPRVGGVSEPTRTNGHNPVILAPTSLSAPQRLHIPDGMIVAPNTVQPVPVHPTPHWPYHRPPVQHYTPSITNSITHYSYSSDSSDTPQGAPRPVGIGSQSVAHRTVHNVEPLSGSRTPPINQPQHGAYNTQPALGQSHLNGYPSVPRSAGPSPSPRIANTMTPHGEPHPFGPMPSLGPPGFQGRQAIHPQSNAANGIPYPQQGWGTASSPNVSSST